MRARLALRHRIVLLVALAAVGLVTVTVVTLILGRRGERQLQDIETRYVPLIELDRDLDALVASIPRTLADAAETGEASGLIDADALVEAVAGKLRSGAASIVDNGGDPAALERELRGYYAIAREVSAALVADTPAADIEARIVAMRQAQQQLTAALDTATTPDRERLAAAFAAARASQQDALWIEIFVATSAFAVMALLSWGLIRHIVRSLRAVSVGVERLARGEFGEEIPATTDDEIGALAREANRTAGRLREYRERTEALLAETQRQAEELGRVSRYKSEFLANMSHELRTPLNSVMILSQLLAANDEHNLTDKQVELAVVIRKSGEELLALINEVLDLAKVEAGKQTLALAPVQLAELAEYLRRMFAPLAGQKQLAFAVELAPDLPGEIRTDWSRLAQVLKNLIANALKFTARGGVTVRITRAGDDAIELAITDTGIGIPAKQHAWIFEAFAQAETGTSRKFGGTGLGLTIAKQLAIRLGGDLTVESEPGAGSTFRVRVPVAGPAADDAGARADLPAADATTLVAASPRISGPLPSEPAPVTVAPVAPDAATILAGRTLLIVDDDMRNVYALASSLGGKHVDIIPAADGREAIAELDAHPDVDAVIIDLAMPGMDGLEAIGRIRSQDRFRSLPIIVLTGRAAAGQEERCLAAGASAYLVQPVDLGRLVGLLRELLSQRPRRAGAGS